MQPLSCTHAAHSDSFGGILEVLCMFEQGLRQNLITKSVSFSYLLHFFLS